MRAPYPSFGATIDDEEEDQLQPRRRTKITSGKMRTTDTTAVKEVLCTHKLVLTPDGQPATYESLSCMAFVNDYFSIMALQMDTMRSKMAIDLHEMMEYGETFRWLVVRAAPAFGAM